MTGPVDLTGASDLPADPDPAGDPDPGGSAEPAGSGGVSLDGAGALVTGGASGIGAALARRLAAAGARVAIADRDAEAARRLAGELDGIALPGDVSDPEVLPAHVAAAEREFDHLDVVFLNAGTGGGQPGVSELDVPGYRRVLGVNVDHVVFGVCAAVPALERAGGGTIVATASLAGLTPLPGDPIYTLTKHAVVGYVRAAAPGLAGRGVRLCALCPGFADTPLIAGQRARFEGFPLLSADDVADAAFAVLDRGEPGQAWYVQPGREPGPYGFRGVPSPTGSPLPPDIESVD